eukprot:11210008-Lingulodinium_polyedra.AAC.1
MVDVASTLATQPPDNAGGGRTTPNSTPPKRLPTTANWSVAAHAGQNARAKTAGHPGGAARATESP